MPDSAGTAGPRLIMGSGLTLRRLERRHLPQIRDWLDDVELRAQIGAMAPMSEKDSDEWFERVCGDSHRVWYVIALDEGRVENAAEHVADLEERPAAHGERVIGEAGLLRINPEWRTADMSVVIGDPSARSQGHGTETGRLILDLAFNYYGLHRVAIGVVGFNDEALRFWKRLGFREEGVQRDGYYHGGRFHDFVMMSMLEDEWSSLRREAR